MTKETSKCYDMRLSKGYFDKYLKGNGIDIGGGDDPLVIPNGTVFCYDKEQGNAQTLSNIEDDIYDFVYSSHCLEHMSDLCMALDNWIRICKPGGYIYIVLPHEVYYEKKSWPSLWNADHKWSFTLNEKSELPKNVVITDFLKKFNSKIKIIDIFENLQNYDFSLGTSIDQTLDYNQNVCCHFEIILKKI